jgi:hypothetical protein
MMAKVKPLRKRTMTLKQLRKRTLAVLEACRRQFNHKAYQEGMSDAEFIEGPLCDLVHDIKQDIVMEGMLENGEC